MKVGLKLVWLLAVVSLVSLSSSEFATGADLEYITIYKAEPGRSAMYSIFAPLKDGTLLCAFRDSKMGTNPKTGKRTPWAVSGSRIMCIRSADNGRTWTKTPTFIYQEKDNYAYTSQGGLGHQAKDGTILVPFRVSNPTANQERYDDPLARVRSFIARSTDNGHTWTSEHIPSTPFFSGGLYNGIVHLDDGSLWMSQYCEGYRVNLARANAMSERGEKRARGSRRILESRDDGKTWSHYSYVGYDPTRPKETAHFPMSTQQWEQAIVQLPSGKILVIDRPYMHKWVSLDRGRTWKVGPSTLTRNPKRKESKRGHMGYSGLCPSMCYTKAGPPTGTIVLVYHDRWGEHAKRGGDYVSFSHDEGQTWGYPVFIDGGAYPTLYELEKDSGNFLCGYYYHSSHLKSVFFSVPFPTGLRALPGLEDSEQLGITVKWDEYKGQDYEKYEYRLYRSTQPEFELTPSTLVCSGKDICSYSDKAVEKDRAYYYRVAACLNGKVVNQSWQSSAMVTVNAGF